MEKEKMSFEEGLDRLRRITEKLEEGALSLEDSYKCFEEGIEIANFCEEKLKEIEQKIQVLMKKDEKFYLKDYKDFDQSSQNDDSDQFF